MEYGGRCLFLRGNATEDGHRGIELGNGSRFTKVVHCVPRAVFPGRGGKREHLKKMLIERSCEMRQCFWSSNARAKLQGSLISAPAAAGAIPTIPCQLQRSLASGCGNANELTRPDRR